MQGNHVLDALTRDLAYACRMMRRGPGFTATAILTLALGIGATTAIFTVVSGVLLRPLPFPEPEWLVSIREEQAHGPNDFLGSPEVVEWIKHSRTMSRIGAFFNCSVLIVRRGLAPVAIGEAIGLAAALALNRVIASMLFHIATTDALTYIGVGVFWSMVGAAACYIPARRAIKFDPVEALRCE